MTISDSEIQNLDTSQKLELLDKIWDSLSAHEKDIPLTPNQAKEIEKREKNVLSRPAQGKPWREVFDEIEQKLK